MFETLSHVPSGAFWISEFGSDSALHYLIHYYLPSTQDCMLIYKYVRSLPVQNVLTKSI